MSTPETEGAAEAAPKKKSKLFKLLLIGAGMFTALGGVFAGGLYAAHAGLIPGMEAKKAADKPAEPEVQYEEDEDGHKRVKTSYQMLEGSFTTNLSGSGRLVQLEIGVSTNYDPKYLEAVKTHEMPIRSAVLGVLAQQTDEAFATPQARTGVRRQLKGEINRIMAEKAGYPAIGDVYFTTLVIQ